MPQCKACDKNQTKFKIEFKIAFTRGSSVMRSSGLPNYSDSTWKSRDPPKNNLHIPIQNTTECNLAKIKQERGNDHDVRCGLGKKGSLQQNPTITQKFVNSHAQSVATNILSTDLDVLGSLVAKDDKNHEWRSPWLEWQLVALDLLSCPDWPVIASSLVACSESSIVFQCF